MQPCLYECKHRTLDKQFFEKNMFFSPRSKRVFGLSCGNKTNFYGCFYATSVYPASNDLDGVVETIFKHMLLGTCKKGGAFSKVIKDDR